MNIKVIIAVLVLASFSLAAFADDSEATAAKQSQNPVASIISVPSQSTINFGVGADDGVGWVNLVQPIFPQDLGESVNLIHRTILPLPMYQPITDVWGMGDILYEGFFSPAHPGAIIWGIGPLLSFPTATSPSLGSGKWSAGPAFLVLGMPGDFVLGALLTQLWSFAGDSSRDSVSLMSLQYFINYNIKNSGGWYLSSTPTMTADWTAADGEVWTIPVGGGFGKMFVLKTFALDLKLQAFVYVAKPTGGPDWALQVLVKTLFPKKAK